MVLKLGYLEQGSRCKYIGSSEMCYLRRMELRSFGHRVGNEVLNGTKEDMNIMHTTKKKEG